MLTPPFGTVSLTEERDIGIAFLTEERGWVQLRETFSVLSLSHSLFSSLEWVHIFPLIISFEEKRPFDFSGYIGGPSCTLNM